MSQPPYSSAAQAAHWDVIILGAGPAGLALARRLAPRRVLVLERKGAAISASRINEPRIEAPYFDTPRIGESLPGAASVLLQRLGLLESFMAAGHLERGASAALWDTEIPVWRYSLRDPLGPGWHLNRRLFEQMLTDGAHASGAKIHYNCRNIQLNQHAGIWQLDLESSSALDLVRHTAPIVVDATGRSAGFARRLGVAHTHHDPLLCVHSFLTSPPGDEDSTTRTLADRNGWWYTVRTNNGMRVLAYHLDADDPERQSWQQPEVLLARARRHPFLAEVLEGTAPAAVAVRPAGTAILDIANLSSAGRGFLAIGDAAITFDPIASQGLFNALASAESAAQAIAHNFQDSPAALHAFQAELHAVASRYLHHLHNTYQGPQRFAHLPFWAKRRSQQILAEKFAVI